MDADLQDWCERALGSSPEEVFFRADSMSAVSGVLLADRRRVAVKARTASDRVLACAEAHRRAIAAGIDYLAPYYNRMEAFGIDAAGTLEAMAGFITRSGSPSKIVAASFKNVSQVTRAFEVGCQAVTVAPSLLSQALAAPHITSAVDAFVADWESVFDTTTLP